MNEETEIVKRTEVSTSTETVKPESHFYHISIRAWITLVLILAVVWMSVTGLKIEEPLYTLVGMVVAYYFGQREKPKNQT